MSEFRVNSITNQDGSAGPQVCGVSTFSGKSGVQIPSGSSDFRRQDGGGRGRGIISGGRNLPAAGSFSAIDMIEIPTTGNATDFGDLATTNTGGAGGSSSTTRAFIVGGYDPGPSDHLTTMQYVTLSSQGGANLFGDLRSKNTAIGQGSNNTRGLLYGGNDPNYIADIFQFNLQSLGTETDFGKVFENEPIRNVVVVTSPTRAVFGGGDTGSQTSLIAFREIASGGTVFKFGDLTYDANGHTGASGSTRGVFAGGKASPTTTTNIDFITIASEGNGQDFGDLTQARRNISANSNSIRATFAGGTTASSGTGNNVNTIDFVTIATTGNAVDFGDLSAAKRLANMGGSDSHGGLTQ